MDPITAVGLAASTDQLAGVARRIVSNLYQYYEAVRDAPKSALELRAEMGAVCALLESLAATITENTASASLRDAVAEFENMLNDMNAKVDLSKTKGMQRLKWPFNKDENERLLSRIGRYKDTFNLALNIQST
jgi:hypothetical protein